MHTTVVGVLRGGPSREHEVSLKSGHSMIANLPRERFTVRDIYIDKNSIWHERGLSITPGNILPTIDVAIIKVHGDLGENGELQKILERFNVPYTGADSFHSFHASHKVLSKERAKERGIRTPRYILAESRDRSELAAHEAVRTFRQPVVVKPALSTGSSLGVSIVGGYQAVYKAIVALFNEDARGVMVEERIHGTEATVGVVEGLRGESLYALPPIEIIPEEGQDFFSYEAKYSGNSQEICPGRFSREDADELMRAAKVMHEALGQRHYSRSDFIVSDKGIYFLELNTAAAVGMTSGSLMPKALEAVGVNLPEFATHLVDLALRK